jgi:Delta7-sterol 5-desaturase
MARELLDLVAMIAAAYAVFLSVYFVTCWAVIWLNRRHPAKKLQDRVESPERIRDDRRQSVRSLVSIAAMFGLGQWTYYDLGWGWRADHLGLIGTVLSAMASLLIFDAWFYWLHRLIHTPALYARIHRWHHMTVTPEVWSNNSDLLIDNLFLQSYWLVAHFIIPVAPLVLLVHKIYDQISAVLGHSGYEYAGLFAWPPSPLIAVTHHDQHHRFGRCNYGTHFVIWDRLMGTLHQTHDEELRRNLRL